MQFRQKLILTMVAGAATIVAAVIGVSSDYFMEDAPLARSQAPATLVQDAPLASSDEPINTKNGIEYSGNSSSGVPAIQKQEGCGNVQLGEGATGNEINIQSGDVECP